MRAAETTPAVIAPEKIKAALENHLFAEVWTPEGDEVLLNTYAVLDGASIPDLLDHLYVEQDRPEFVCLYRGELEPDIAEVAPYLVRLEQGTPFTDWLLTECWGKHFGVFMRSVVDLQTLRRHFRRFLRVKGPDDRILYFRFYDPRVMNIFLPTCHPEDLGVIFGSLHGYFCESEKNGILLEHAYRESKLTSKELSVRPTSSKSSI